VFSKPTQSNLVKKRSVASSQLHTCTVSTNKLKKPHIWDDYILSQDTISQYIKLEKNESLLDASTTNI